MLYNLFRVCTQSGAVRTTEDFTPTNIYYLVQELHIYQMSHFCFVFITNWNRAHMKDAISFSMSNGLLTTE